jgi:Flp pilus assembly protein CpaB
MAIEFYDVKTKVKVKVEEKDIVKVTYASDKGRVTYAIRGKYDGRTLTKFVSKADWDKLAVKEEKAK